MSFDKNEEYINWELIYKPFQTLQKILLGKNEQINIFEMIYKPKEKKLEKKEKIKKFKTDFRYVLDDDKEYSEDLLRILGKYFVKHNKNKSKLIYNNKKYELKEYFEEIDNNYKNKDIIKLKIIGLANITDVSRMFYGCYYLSSVNEYTKKPTQRNFPKKINLDYNANSSIYEEIKLDYQKFLDNNNDTHIINDFYKEYIQSLFPFSTVKNNDSNSFNENANMKNEIPILHYNRNIISNMNQMFSGCISLISIPDISKFDTYNVRYMNSMFFGCDSLKTLPDLSKWNTYNVVNMRALFNNCNSLISLPDLSKWNTPNVICIDSMFQLCNSLESLPDLSKWDISNAIELSYMFNKCSSLKSLPDISKWNTSNITNMRGLFNECKSLKSFPDISKWNTSNVIDMIGLFCECNSLTLCVLQGRRFVKLYDIIYQKYRFPPKIIFNTFIQTIFQD